MSLLMLCPCARLEDQDFHLANRLTEMALLIEVLLQVRVLGVLEVSDPGTRVVVASQAHAL